MHKLQNIEASQAWHKGSAESLRDANGTLYGGWKTAFAALIGMTFGPSCVIVFCFGTFVMPLENEFHWGVGAISFGATLLTLMIVLMSIVAGRISDRFGARTLVLWSIPLFGISVMSLSLLNDSLKLFYTGLIVAAALGVGVWPVTYNKITSNWFDRHLGLSLGIANTGIGIGAALLPALAAYIAQQYGWRQAYLVLGALAIVIPWPLAWAYLKEAPRTADGSALLLVAPCPVEKSLSEALKDRQLWLVLIGFFALGAASSSVIVHQVRILVDTGMPMPRAVAMQSVLGVAMIVARLCTGWLLDRLHVAVIMTALCIAAAVALILLSMGAPFGTAALCACLIGFVVGAEFDVLGFLIPRYFGRKAFGSIYALVFAVFQVAAALMISVLGWIRTLQGSYFVGLLIIAGMLMLAATVFVFMSSYRNPVKQSPHSTVSIAD